MTLPVALGEGKEGKKGKEGKEGKRGNNGSTTCRLTVPPKSRQINDANRRTRESKQERAAGSRAFLPVGAMDDGCEARRSAPDGVTEEI